MEEQEEFTEEQIAQMRERYIAPVIELMKQGKEIGTLGDMIDMNFSNRNTGQQIHISYNEWIRQNNEFDRKQMEYIAEWQNSSNIRKS